MIQNKHVMRYVHGPSVLNGIASGRKNVLVLSRASVVSINLHQLSYTVGNKVNGGSLI